MREELKKEILRLINLYDGKLSWYRIARSITDERFLSLSDQIGDILKEIENERLVTIENGLFGLTPVGQKYVEAFSVKELQTA